MDTEFDFLLPEFFNLLFFQQKNLVIFPYVDIKHLHSLDTFTLGYEIVDIDAAVLHNLEDVLTYELNSSYSHSAPFYFIQNANANHVEQLLEMRNIHCIINTNEDVSHMVKGNEFIFYNKKNKSFLNYNFENTDLNFEREILQGIRGIPDLIDEVYKIKHTASKVFRSINANGSGSDLPVLLNEFDTKYWDKILLYIKLFYDIEIPELSQFQIPTIKTKKKNLKDFSDEYSVIVKSNKKIGQEFIQALHDYRYRKVNPANLEKEELFYPQKLYNYLRNHHWKSGIPQDFIDEWVTMKNSGNYLLEEDWLDFRKLFQKLKMELNITPSPRKKEVLVNEGNLISNLEGKKSTIKRNDIEIPSIDNFQVFQKWLIQKLTRLETIFKKEEG